MQQRASKHFLHTMCRTHHRASKAMPQTCRQDINWRVVTCRSSGPPSAPATVRASPGSLKHVPAIRARNVVEPVGQII